MAILESNTHWGRPRVAKNGTGVLVLTGSSGRIDTGRVDMLATRGITAMGLRWFGGEALPAVPLEVPLEYFSDAIDLLSRECDRLVVMGLSYGAEAALLTATIDHRLAVVVALQPTDVAWEGQARDDDDPHLSKWTLHGRPVPFVPMDRTWRLPPAGKPAFVDFYEHSRAIAHPDVVAAAEIPVEQIRGQVLLVAGGDDKVWASLSQAKRIAARREAAALPTAVVSDERAGHQVVLPGEAVPDLDRPYQVGGNNGAPQRLGEAAWPHIAHLLGITP